MADDTRAEETRRAFIDKLVAFRTGLAESERPMLDSLVVKAFDGEADVEAHTAGAAELPSEERIREFAGKLRALQATMPAEDAQLLDGLVREAARPDDAEVEAHFLLWRETVPNVLESPVGATRAYYEEKCAASGSELSPTYLTERIGYPWRIFECWLQVDSTIEPAPRSF